MGACELEVLFFMCPGLSALLTVGFLYGAGAEFRDRHLRKVSKNSCLPAEKPKSAVYTQKTKRNRCLSIPELRFGYLGETRNFSR